VLASIAADILAGHTLNAIRVRLNDAGIPTATGKAPWTGPAVRHVITKPAIAGLLTYRGETVGPAPWPAILDAATWQTVRDELSTRTPRVDSTLTHWLAGVLLCGVDGCGMALRGNGARYWCGSTTSRGMQGCGRISIVAEPTERAIGRLVVKRAARARLRPSRPVKSIAPDDSQLLELGAMWTAREITLAEYRAMRAELLARATPPPAPSLPAWVGPGLADEWDDLPATAKRRVTAALLEGVTVHPSPSRRWSPDRLEPHWR
jgi:hypothetical protein